MFTFYPYIIYNRRIIFNFSEQARKKMCFFHTKIECNEVAFNICAYRAWCWRKRGSVTDLHSNICPEHSALRSPTIENWKILIEQIRTLNGMNVHLYKRQTKMTPRKICKVLVYSFPTIVSLFANCICTSNEFCCFFF